MVEDLSLSDFQMLPGGLGYFTEEPETLRVEDIDFIDEYCKIGYQDRVLL